MLSDTACKNAHKHVKAASGKPFKLSDEKGLYLLVKPQVSGWGKWWRFKYRFDGKEKSISFGTYPDTTLLQAKGKRDMARKQLAEGIDPGENRKAVKLSKAGSGADSFEPIAREWWEHKKGSWTEGHVNRNLTRLVNDVFPYLGATPINDITAITLLETIRRIEARGAIESAHRTDQACEGVFAYAIGTGRCENNPATA